MRQRGRWLTVVLLLFGIVAPGGSPRAQTPVPVTAEPEFPPPGTTLVIRRVDPQGVTSTRSWTVLEEGTYEGKPVYRASVAGSVVLFDKATRNLVATLRDDKVIDRYTPDRGTFSWPLSVGKSWEARFARHEDQARGPRSSTGRHRVTVEAYEAVTVPAGMFKAFRLREAAIRGGGSTTFWYAPEIAWIVKTVEEASPGLYRGPGKLTTDLIEYRRAGASAAAPQLPAARPASPPAPPQAAAASPGMPATPGPTTRGEFTYKVTYRVKGTASSVMLTYRNAQGGTAQSSVHLPWEVTFDARGGSFLYVSAQNQGVSGSVTCEILLDGQSRTNSTSNGAYVIAECSNAADH